MALFLASTFSPVMLKPGREAYVEEISLADVCEELRSNAWTSVVGHEVTAAVLSALLGCQVVFSRINLALDHDDRVLCVIPAFRAAEAREFSLEEVESAGYRCFAIDITDLR